jgi:hypothetical protein
MATDPGRADPGAVYCAPGGITPVVRPLATTSARTLLPGTWRPKGPSPLDRRERRTPLTRVGSKWRAAAAKPEWLDD